MIVTCVGSAPSMLDYLDQALDGSDVVVAAGTASGHVDADWIAIRSGHWKEGVWDRIKPRLQPGRPMIVVQSWLVGAAYRDREFHEWAITQIPDENLLILEGEWLSFPQHKTTYRPGKNVWTRAESGIFAFQFAIKYLNATEVRCVGMTGWTNSPGRFTGGFVLPKIAHQRKVATECQRRFFQDTIDLEPDVQFIFYGPLSNQVSGPNVTNIK